MSPKHSSPFRSECLRGKVALITGGGSGICYEITRQLLLHGCTGAVICGRRESFLLKAAESLKPKKCMVKVCDVRNPSQCQSAVEFAIAKFGRLDILVNGAAGNFLSPAGELSPKGFKTVMEIDAQGTFNMSSAAYPYMKRTRGDNTSVIINISAMLQSPATWYVCHASAAKAAVDSLTRSLALEWGSEGIRVCGIAPGPIADTPGTTKLAPGVDEKGLEEMIADGIPLGRLGESFEIGMAAVFLSSDGSGSFVTGDVLTVDGGEWLYRPPMMPKEMVAELSRKVESKSRLQAPRQVSKL